MYAAVCTFDDRTTRKIEDFRELLKRHQIPLDRILKPHISLAVYDTLDPDKALPKMQILSEKTHSFTLNLTHFGTFHLEKSVMYLSPDKKSKQTLLDIHSEYHKIMEDFLPGESAYYTPGNWTSHCTLSIDMTDKDVHQSIPLLHSINLPLQCTVKSLELWEFYPTKRIRAFNL